MTMTPDEVVKVFKEMNRTSKDEEVDSWYAFSERIKALDSAISIIQDYQKLRERVSVENLEHFIEDYESKNGLFCKLTDREHAQAIVTYLGGGKE